MTVLVNTVYNTKKGTENRTFLICLLNYFKTLEAKLKKAYIKRQRCELDVQTEHFAKGDVLFVHEREKAQGFIKPIKSGVLRP